MLIDTSYFYGDLSIAQITQASVASTVNRLIQQYEPKFLKDLLGFALYESYRSGIAVSPTPDAKWTNLRDGVVFTDRFGVSSKWEGLRRLILPASSGIPAQYESPIANYIYYWYMRSNATTTAGSGEVIANVSQPVSPADKMARAWNQMVDWNRELIEFLYSSNVVYGVDSTLFYIGRNNIYHRSNNLLSPINTLGI